MIRTLLLAALLAGPAAAQAGILDQVKAAGVLHCGAAARAGFADAAEDGRVTGLAVDLCRALTIAVLGPRGTAAFRIYGSERDFAAAPGRTDDVSFLAGEEVRSHGLAASLVPGPVVFVAELTALAQPGLSSLPGRTVCFMNGSTAHQALEAWAARTNTPFVRSGYQEEGELHDAFGAHRCDAMAGEATELADFRGQPPSRGAPTLLPAFAILPVRAASPASDGAWAALVGWAMEAVVESEHAPNPWRADLPGTDIPGLRPSWLADVSAILGSYDDMTRRHLGSGSPLGLVSHANALWPDGLLLPPGPR